MTSKVVELIVDIPDSHTPITSEELVNTLSVALENSESWRALDLPPITEIRVTKAMPSFVKTQPVTEDFELENSRQQNAQTTITDTPPPAANDCIE
jgi:hypothetical protein